MLYFRTKRYRFIFNLKYMKEKFKGKSLFTSALAIALLTAGSAAAQAEGPAGLNLRNDALQSARKIVQGAARRCFGIFSVYYKNGKFLVNARGRNKEALNRQERMKTDSLLKFFGKGQEVTLNATSLQYKGEKPKKIWDNLKSKATRVRVRAELLHYGTRGNITVSDLKTIGGMAMRVKINTPQDQVVSFSIKTPDSSSTTETFVKVGQ